VAQQAQIPRIVSRMPARLHGRGLRFRAGIEGRIRVWRRRLGLDRCRGYGEAGLGRWGMVTANLLTIAQRVAGRLARRLSRAA
jgi:hypothetical protein